MGLSRKAEGARIFIGEFEKEEQGRAGAARRTVCRGT